MKKHIRDILGPEQKGTSRTIAMLRIVAIVLGVMYLFGSLTGGNIIYITVLTGIVVLALQDFFFILRGLVKEK